MSFCKIDLIVVFLTFAVNLCYGQDPCSVAGDVRLVNGGSSMEGRVELCNGTIWGTVCDDFWAVRDATVVCRQLGFAAATAAPENAFFGEGTGPILLSDLACLGNEPNLLACPDDVIRYCNHDDDASAICINEVTTCVEGTLRLQDGNTTSGRLEACHSNLWGTVCDDSFRAEDAGVACRQLGFSYDNATIVECCSEFGMGTGAILFDGLNCLGNETMLSQCYHTTEHNCDHDEDVGLICQPLPVVFPLWSLAIIIPVVLLLITALVVVLVVVICWKYSPATKGLSPSEEVTQGTKPDDIPLSSTAPGGASDEAKGDFGD